MSRFNKCFVGLISRCLLREFLCLAFIFIPLTHSSARASDDWRRIARYNNFFYFTELHSRLVKGSSSLSEGRRIIFQIKLVGHSLGAMEFDYSCSSKQFLFERVIPIPDTAIREFRDSAKDKFEKHKSTAASYYCNNFPNLNIISSPENGDLLYENKKVFSEEALNTCLGARAMKDLIDGYPARFCMDIYRENGFVED